MLWQVGDGLLGQHGHNARPRGLLHLLGLPGVGAFGVHLPGHVPDATPGALGHAARAGGVCRRRRRDLRQLGLGPPAAGGRPGCAFKLLCLEALSKSGTPLALAVFAAADAIHINGDSDQQRQVRAQPVPICFVSVSRRPLDRAGDPSESVPIALSQHVTCQQGGGEVCCEQGPAELRKGPRVCWHSRRCCRRKVITPPACSLQVFRATGGKALVWGEKPRKVTAHYTTADGASKSSLLLASGRRAVLHGILKNAISAFCQ